MFISLKQHNHTKGSITVEALMVLPIVIIIFSCFLYLIAYISVITTIKNDLHEKVLEMAVYDYAIGFSLPTIVRLYDKEQKDTRHLTYAFCHSETFGNQITLVFDGVFNGYVSTSKIHLSQTIYKFNGDHLDYDDEFIWELDNFTRGEKVEILFGGNLPRYFPTIDYYDELTGKVLSITSVNTTYETYQNYIGLYERIVKDINKLNSFKGTIFEDISIDYRDITQKELLVVLPTNSLNREQLAAIEELTIICKQFNILFTIKRYQKALIE
ncbi:MAG: hypothetical protein KAG94_03850 [Clostridiales bacterium]|nr:hypothetical protein [Clostridiales bacterium]